MNSFWSLLFKILLTVSVAGIGLTGCKQGADSVDQFLDGIGNGDDDTPAPEPTLDLDPSAHDFGPLLTTAGTPLSQTVTVRNLNTETLFVDSVTAPTSSDFTLVSETCSAITAGLATNDSCSFVVDFQPATSGNKAYAVTVKFGKTAGDSSLGVTMNLTGFGAAPANLAISDGPTFDYGSVVVTAVAEKTFNISNTGNVPATTVAGTGLAAPFAFKGGSYPGTGGTCSATINDGTTCTVVVTYNPGSTGAANDTILLNYHNGDIATSSSRDIQGTGSTAAVLALSDGPTFNYGTFAIGASSDKVFTLSNSGGVTATGVAGTGIAAPYSFKGGTFPGTGGSCASTLASSANCTIVVTFTPTVATVSNDSVDVNYFDGLNAQTASRPITATGANPASLSVNGGPTYNFGTVTVGNTSEVTLTVDNTGGFSASSLTGTSLASPFAFKGGSYPGTGGTCGSSLAASTNCTVVITYSPSIAGVQNDALSMDYNNGASAQSATRPLQGTAVTPANLTINQGPTHDFGTLPVGGSADVTLTVNNTGGVNATSVVGGGLAAPYSYKGGAYPGTGGTCAATINSGANCTVVVTYSPSGTGTHNDSVDLSYNNGVAATNSLRALTGNAVTAASLALSDGPTFDFGSEPIGKTVEATLTLTNSGGFNASSISGSGLGAPFTFKGGAYPGTGGTCSANLAGSSNCTIVVTFTPGGLGLAPDQIDINYNDGVGAQATNRPIQGTGVNPGLISISDGPTYDFGSVAVSATAEHTLTLTNTGGYGVTSMAGSGLAAPFTFKGGSFPGTGGTCGATLAASNNCTVIVEYSPTGLGSHNDTLDISYNDGVSAQNSTRDIQGLGANPASLSITDGPTYDYGSQPVGASVTKTFTVNNGGGVTATSMAGTGLATPFVFFGGTYPGTGGTCGTSLNATNSCTIVVEYNPSATGSHNDTIDVTYNDSLVAQTASRDIQGTAVTPAALTISNGPTATFSTVAVGGNEDLTLTVQNTGNFTASALSGAGLAAPYTFKGGAYPGTGGTCSTTLNASSSCTVVLTYSPVATGTHNDTLDINYSDGVNAQVASRDVQGSGAAPASLAISDGPTHNYGSQAVGGSIDKTFTITNSGGVSATGMSGTGLAAPYTFKGGSYPGTGGTCLAILAGSSANCTIVVTYSPTGSGVHNDTIDIPYNTGVTGQSATRDVTGTGVAAATIDISDGPVFSYGTVVATSSNDKVFTLTNNGDVSATSLAGSGLAAPFSFKGGSFPGTGGNCAGTLASSANCNVVVTFNPSANGTYNDTIDISFDNSITTTNSTRDIQGIAAAAGSLTISDGPTYNFGSHANGSTNEKTFTITNGGGVTVTSMAGTGLAAPFSFKGGSYPGTGGNCGVSLNASSNCTIVVEFSPGTINSFNDTIEINYNDGLAGQTANRAVSGTSVAPGQITISDGATYDYGSVAVGGSSDKTFTLTNAGAVTVTSMTGAGLAAPFSFKGGSYPGTGGDCGASLASSLNCTIVVTYAPSATGAQADTIEIDYHNGATTVQSTRPIQGTGASPALLAVSDGPTFDYGSLASGGTADKTFTVSNSGGVTATSMAGTGLAAPFVFKGGSYPGTGGNCSTSLTASNNCTIVVTYNPGTLGADADTISVDYNNGVTTTSGTRAIQGTSVSPASLTMSDGPTYNFGAIANGGSADKTITVTNGGGVTATSMAGSGLAAPYSFKGGSYPGTGGTCSTSLAASGNCTIVITFSPSSTGSYNDTIDIDYNNGASAQTSQRDLDGSGAPPASLAISDGATYDFGGVPDGGNAEKTFTVTNSGGVAATSMAGTGISAPYTFKGGSYPGTGGTCSTSLAASGNCTIVVSYDPTSQVVHNDTIDVNYDDGTGAQTASRPVTGTGLAPALLAINESPTYDFGTVATGSSNDKTFIVTNTGGFNASSMAGAGLAAPYTFKGGSYPGTGGTCSTDLAASGNCTIVVNYSPSAAATHNDTIEVNYNNGASAQTASRPVTANAAAPASITISDGATYNYGTVANGSNTDKTFTVTNGGGVAATGLGAGGLAPPYSFKGGSYPGTGGDCSTSLNASANCTVVVTFSPASSNTYNDTLQVSYNDGAAAQNSDRDITGTSVAPANLTISDGPTYDFGTVANTASVDKIFTITNAGGFNASSMSGTGLAAPYTFKGGSYPGTGGTCNTDLAASGNCTIVVTYNPTATGSHPDAVQIDYDNGATSTNVSRNLSGAGAPAASLTISDGATYDFGTVANGTVHEKTFTVTNGGGVTATTMAGSGLAAPYTFKGGAYPGTGGTCSTSLVATDNCTVVVLYSPTTNVTHNDTLEVVYDNGIAGGQTSSRPVTGAAQAPAVLTISDGGTYDFGTIANGASAEKTFTINNTGTFAASTVAGTGLASPYSFKGGGFPGTGGSCTTSLAGGGNCTIVVTFIPGSSATHNDTIEINYFDGAAARQATRPITGISATPAVLTMSEGPLYDYGTVANTTTKDRTFTVSNSGGVEATSLAGAGLAAPFDFKGGTFPGTGGTCNTGTVAAAGNCTIVVTYTPGASVTSNDTIELTYNDGVASQGSNRNIRGTAATPAVVTISDGATYDYGVVPTGASADKTFTLSNSGEMAATAFGAGGLAAPFNFKGGTYPGVGGTCSTSLNGSDNCTIVVTFSPVTTGSPSDSILVSYNDGAVVQTPSRDIQGVAAAPALLTVSDGVTFNYGTVVTGSSNDKTFTLTNSGGVAATSIAGVGLAAPYSYKGGSFPGTGGNCGTSLGDGANCTFVVTFSPGTAATHNDTAEVNYNDGVTGQTATRPLTGVAVAPALLELSDGPTYDYGPTYTSETKDKSFTVTNNGGFAASSMAGSGLVAPYQFKGGSYPGTGGNCGTSLSVSANCTIVVTYAPSSTGLDADIVNVDYFDGAINTQAQRNLTGTGQSPDAPGNPGTPALAITAGDQLDLTWTAPATGTPPFTYDVYRSTTSGSGHVAVQTGLIVTNWQDTGVTAGTEYFYIIRVNAPGGTADSAESSGTPLADFTITSVTPGDQLVDVVFDSSAGATSYTVKYGTTSGSHPSISSSSATSPHQVTSLTAGTEYFFMVTAVNSTGSLDATLEDSATPFAIAQKLVSGMRSRGNCAILSNGMLKCWGQATFGMIGNGADAIRGDSTDDTGDNATITDMGTGRTATKIANSPMGFHSCAILDDASLKCWGRNDYGQLGQEDTDNKGDSSASIGDNLNAINLGTGRTATDVAVGLRHTCAVLDNGWVKCWGRGNRGQLGLGNTQTRGDETNEMGDFLSPVDLGTGRTATAVAVGDEFSCALLDDATVKCWGRNGSGQLGQENTTQLGDGANEMGDNLNAIDLGTGRTAVQIEAGNLYACARLDNNAVKCWGEGGTGQLGTNSNQDLGNQANEMGDNLNEIDLGTGRTATDIAVGYDHTCAVLDDSTVKCWGQGQDGALGQGNQNDLGNGGSEMGDNLNAVNVGTGRTVLDVSAGFRSTCARLDNNTTKCWGYNNSAQTGNQDENLGDVGDGGGEMGDPMIPLAVGTGRTVAQVDAGREVSCSIRDDGKVICYGSNSYSMLGIGEPAHVGDEPGEMGQNLAAVNLGTGLTASHVTMGFQHTCVLLNTGQVKCWGRNNYGQLGYEDTVNRGTSLAGMGDALPVVDLGTGRTATDITAGLWHTCAVLDNGTVKCWGRNHRGQLGQGNTTTRGDNASEMGDNLGVSDMGTGRTATQIVAGDEHTCALLDNNTVKCWGEGGQGRLGYGNQNDLGNQANEMGDNLAAVDLGTGRTATAVGVGRQHSCALLDDSTIKCWGEGSRGRLGSASAADLGDGGGEMGDNLNPVDLGTGRTAKKLNVGYEQTCVILDNDAAKCWGEGASGRLGQGSQTDLGDAASEIGDNLPEINLGTGLTAKEINTNLDSTCVITNDDKVRCWGYNLFGTLGRGDVTTIGDNPAEMGSGLNTADVW